MSGAERGELALLRAEALRWRGEISEAERWVNAAMATLSTSSRAWYSAVGAAMTVASLLEQRERLAALADLLASAWSREGATDVEVVVTAQASRTLRWAGLYDRAEVFHVRIQAMAERFRDDPTVSGYVLQAWSQ